MIKQYKSKLQRLAIKDCILMIIERYDKKCVGKYGPSILFLGELQKMGLLS